MEDSPLPGLFVTATGTDIGKTFVTAGLVRACRRAGLEADAMKPVMSGFDPETAATSDAGLLLASLGRNLTSAALDVVAPWRFAAPVSPHMAAAWEGRSILFAELVAACRSALCKPQATFVEGVGGVMVPLDDRHTILDLVAALGCPVLLVSGTALGAISHCLSAVAALSTRQIAPRLILLNESAGSEVPTVATTETIRSFCPEIPVTVLPRHASEEAFDALLVLLGDAIGSFRRDGTAATDAVTRV